MANKILKPYSSVSRDVLSYCSSSLFHHSIVFAVSPDSLQLDSALSLTLLILTQHCPRQRSAWLKALPVITQLDSALSRTRSAWLSAVPDITQLHLVNLWVVVIVYINTFLTKQYIVGSGSGCGIVPWRSRDFFHFFTHKKLSQDFACNKNIGFQISLKTSYT